MARLAARLALVAGAVLIALVLAEVALRLAGYNYSPMQIDVREEVPATRADRRFHHAFEDKHFTFDPRLLWRPRAGRSVFNAQGYRGPELASSKPAGEFRVFAFGDSNTLGWGGPHGANWPLYLGELLAATDERLVTVNAGVWGYTAFQGLRRLEETLALEPDLVLVSFGSNDGHPVYLTDSEFAERLAGAAPPGLSRLKLGQLGFAFWDRVVRPGADEMNAGERELSNRVPVEEYERLLGEIARLGRERGFACLFLTRPYLGVTMNERLWKFHAPRYLEATAEAARDGGVPLIDLHRMFREERQLFKDESHFTKMGHRIAAKRIYDELAPLLVERAGVDPSRLLPSGIAFAEQVAIDAGTPEGRQYLLSGFSRKDRTRERTAVRSRGPASVVEFLLRPGEGAYALVVEARPFREHVGIEAEVSVNGAPIGSLRFEEGWERRELAIPAGHLREGVNAVVFSYARLAESEARKPPSLVFDRIGLVPQNER